jgi:Protein of unknown function (DUF3105)
MLRSVLVLTLLLVASPAVSSAQGRQIPNEGQQHIPNDTSGVYKAPYPPTSGQHWGNIWADWEMYDHPIPPEVFVHNLEHGGIVLLYRCDAPCPDVVAQLRDLYRTFPKAKNAKVKMVVAPDPKIRTPFAILAWTWIDELPAFDRDRLLRFYRAHVDKGPEDVP